ncbi:MAG TPA: transaldolase family protein [Ktedonobacteraceae bacterium]|nr:transaldolase family protein [Ktedonobacteraceae bacterium]
MALYIDCAYLDDIIQVAKTIPLAGVTMNPTILLAARERGQRLDPLSLLRELVQSVGGTIFMQPGATREEEMLKEALAYIEVAPGRVIPKIPMTQTGMRVVLRLRLLKHSVAFTAVCSVAQAYSGAMAQADFVIPYFNRMERAGVDASERIAQMAELLHSQQLPTRILAASIKTRVEAATALLAGAHDLTMTPAVLLDMVVDQQSERAVEQFSQDWQKMNTL